MDVNINADEHVLLAQFSDDGERDLHAEKPDHRGSKTHRRLEAAAHSGKKWMRLAMAAEQRMIERSPMSKAAEGETPLRFLLRWKLKDGKNVANARVIMQGFIHMDVLSGTVGKEAQTLSRPGRNVIYLQYVTNGWGLVLGRYTL
jgi:hypothetical protein